MELGNPVWHALRGPQATVAEGGPLALRYQQDVALFAALPDEATPEAWDQLRDVVGPNGYAFLAREVLEPPAGWEQVVLAAGGPDGGDLGRRPSSMTRLSG